MSRSWNPINDLMLLQDRMTKLFEDATQRRGATEGQLSDEVESADWYPPADVAESESEYLITIDLPGIDRSALDINIDEHRLAIRGTRTLDTAPKHRLERPRGRFVRSFGVPNAVDQAKISAEYKDGVLSVILPKRAEQKTRKVEIKIS
jgi:HSP20 family protein